MCGIFCSLFDSECDQRVQGDILEACSCNLRSRGPDYFESLVLRTQAGHVLNLAASVLQTQGKKLCPQPYSKSKNILCWNGDVFGGSLLDDIDAINLCDTEIVSKHLSECVLNGSSPLVIFNQITGPYSFIFYSEEQNTIWFGRDPAGRHSLLYGMTDDPSGFILSSVAHNSLSYLKEVPAIGLFEVDLSCKINNDKVSIRLHPWFELETGQWEEYFSDMPISIELQPHFSNRYIFRPSSSTPSQPSADDLHALSNVPKTLNVAEKMKFLLSQKSFYSNVIKVLSLLEAAVKVRVLTNMSLCQNCMSQVKGTFENAKNNSCTHSKIAILFSGGLDSAILARLVDKFVPQNEPIDLLNVAFEKKLSNASNMRKNLSFEEDIIYDVPDRLSGRKSLQELQNLCPTRKWNFVEINVSSVELQQERSECIGHLIHPLKTVLDDSLGCALWFAARGHGKIKECEENYRSPARVVILGMGADEQFGGYMRHRTTLRNNGWVALQAQLHVELHRIPSRNLGRDDRVVSHHGRQPRMPFLDEDVINFVKGLPPWERCCPTDEYPCGIGDKMLLRLVAWHIGLQGAALMPKRAMQFGSRIANSRENAAHISDRL